MELGFEPSEPIAGPDYLLALAQAPANFDDIPDHTLAQRAGFLDVLGENGGRLDIGAPGPSLAPSHPRRRPRRAGALLENGFDACFGDESAARDFDERELAAFYQTVCS